METTPPYPEEQVDSVGSLVEKVAQWYVGADDVLFRGHRVATWSLVPRLGRIVPRVRFAGSLPELEKKLLADFERLAVPHMGTRQLQSRWDLLALAQHHGLPTRLLDWSSNPLVALWFAVEKPPEASEPAAVWAYRASDEDFVDQTTGPSSIPRTMIFRPRHHDGRIVAQAGWFSIHKHSNSTGRFSTFERLKEQRPKLRKFVIQAQFFPAIRDDLSRCGITRATLFPDLAGLCEYLTWKYERLADEGDYDISTIL